MPDHHRMFTSLARRLRPSAESLAAAAAWQDPHPLLTLRAARPRVGAAASAHSDRRLPVSSPCPA